MAHQGNYFGENYLSTNALTNARFVTFDTTGRIRYATTGDYAEGILENTPYQENMPATINFMGLSSVAVDGAYAQGTFLVPTTNGIGTQASSPTYPYVRAKMIEASSASGDIVAVRLIDEVVGSGVTGVGSKGATGIQGITGFYGQTGIRGVTGIYGLTGLALGATGIQGVTGVISGWSGTLFGATGVFTIASGLIISTT